MPPAEPIPHPGPAADGPGLAGTRDRPAHLAGVAEPCAGVRTDAGRDARARSWSGCSTQGILWEEEGILWIGQKGEEEFGRRNFLELLSVFISPPLFAVLHGRQELGFVDEMTFLGKQRTPGSAAGRPGLACDPHRLAARIAYVELADSVGRSRWQGQGQVLHYDLCQSIKSVLATEEMSERWSNRAQDRICVLRDENARVDPESTVVVSDGDGRLRWWTFAGQRANHVLAQVLSGLTTSTVKVGNLALDFEPRLSLDDLEAAMTVLRRSEVGGVRPVIDESVLDGLKFSACLPTEMTLEMLGERFADVSGAKQVPNKQVRFVDLADQ